MTKLRYVEVGTGGRSSMYINAMCGEFADYAELVGFCDTNHTRMKYWNSVIKKEYGHAEVPMYDANDFDKMIAEVKPDRVIVTSMDRTHHKYICRAMELGCDVVTEKPMTIDEVKCQQIIDTQKKTGRNIIVTFNYRYSPRNTKIKEILNSGIVGEITTVHFEWLLDTCHGADYFRRWHRNKNNNGGLLVHKSTHHFDLVNWWLSSSPKTVFSMADLKFYGKENAEKRGIRQSWARSRYSEESKKDPFALQIPPENELDTELYYNAEHEDGYFRDQNVFGDGISIEDNMSVMVRYKNNTVMTYCLCAHCPWEGYRVVFNGTKGRLEFNVVERPFCEANEPVCLTEFGMHEVADKSNMVPEIIFQPLWGKPQIIDYDNSVVTGHGGGDVKLLKNVFIGGQDDPLGHAAGYVDGANSILTGIAANISMKTGMPVQVKDLVQF